MKLNPYAPPKAPVHWRGVTISTRIEALRSRILSVATVLAAYTSSYPRYSLLSIRQRQTGHFFKEVALLEDCIVAMPASDVHRYCDSIQSHVFSYRGQIQLLRNQWDERSGWFAQWKAREVVSRELVRLEMEVMLLEEGTPIRHL